MFPLDGPLGPSLCQRSFSSSEFPVAGTSDRMPRKNAPLFACHSNAQNLLIFKVKAFFAKDTLTIENAIVLDYSFGTSGASRSRNAWLGTPTPKPPGFKTGATMM